MICEVLWRGFRISNAERVKDFSVLTESKDLMTPFYVGARESLQNKKKGSRISYYERVYLYRIMKQGDISKVQMAIEYNVSQSTLYSIEKEFENPIHNPKLAKSSTNRNLVESPKLREIIQAYLIANRTPWTSKDICSYIQSEIGFVIPEVVVRAILTKVLNLKYKRGLSRLVNFDEEKSFIAKQWFAIKLWRMLDRFEVLINVDESSFSRLTKKNYSWIPKGKEQIIKNICFQNSWSLVTAITSRGGVIAAKAN